VLFAEIELTNFCVAALNKFEMMDFQFLQMQVVFCVSDILLIIILLYVRIDLRYFLFLKQIGFYYEIAS
jgi:hypothetical protein